MQDSLHAIARVQREHGGILDTITDCMDNLNKAIDLVINPMSDVTDADKVHEFDECAVTIYRTLNEHMQFEEREVLPIIVKYAAEIVARGLLAEHKAMLASITELRQKAIDLAGEHSDHAALMINYAGIKVKLDDICRLVEAHDGKQEMVFELVHLASEASEMDSRRDRQT